ncbi:MAG: 3-octaprenyl-4-hydroxybenzoate carboxy-lyase, partial [Chloroflexi bacterium]|nr:3-octaprenyl-4-hydroxybenzoate carboxy-lyase [Chloroflexota bacterium]
MTIRRLIVGISGATGTIYAIRLLEVLQDVENIETHLVMSNAAKRVALLETNYSVKVIEALADRLYDFRDIAAAISSGSYNTIGM